MKKLMVFILSAQLLCADSPYKDAPRDYCPPPSVPHTSFFYTLDTLKLRQKFQTPPPEWMLKRIEKELSPFTTQKISQKALNITYAQASQVAQICARYRFIEGKVYRKGPDPYGMDLFFRTIARSADEPQVPDLPNVDFIWNHDDATPVGGHAKNFWITQDFENQAPILTYARKDDPYLISVPDRFTIPEWALLAKSIQNSAASYPWERKAKKAVWRGQASDYCSLAIGHVSYELTFENYSKQPRYQLCYLSNLYPADIDAGFNAPGFCETSQLVACIAPFQKQGFSAAEHLRWAYLPVLDGYTSTYPGYLWRLLSNSVAFKQKSESSQWFYDALEPYVHYIPIENHMEDLLEKIDWARKNDALCKRISQQASEFVQNNLMTEDIYRYFFCVFQKYLECQNFDLREFLEETETDPSWIRIR